MRHRSTGPNRNMSEDSEPKARPTPLEIPEFNTEQETKAKKHPRAKKDPSIVKEKRGPARPHRRLTTEVLVSRIEKLQKRHDKAKGQLEEAARHLGGYTKEQEMRDSETLKSST